MNSHPDKSGNHSPPQTTPAQERIEETLRTLQETLRRLQDSGSNQDRSGPSSRNRDSSFRGYRTVAPAGPTPSMSWGSSSSLSTSKLPSDGEQSYHRLQAKRRLTKINGKLAKAEDRLGRLTRELNARRDLERRAQAARGEVARLGGIRKEYGDQVRGTSRSAHPGPQSQPKLHGTGRLSPVRAPRRNFHQVHSHNPHRGADRSGNKTGISKAKKGIDWTSLHETNRWRCDFQSDSNGDIEDRHLFTGSESSSSLGWSTSPWPLPYRTAKDVRNDVQKRNEGPTNNKSGSIAKGSNHRSPSRPTLPDLRLQIRKEKQVPDHLLPLQHRAQTPDPNHSHDPRAPEELP